MDMVAILQIIWPLVFSAAVLRMLGQTLKRFAKPPTAGLFWRLYWRTLPLHPVILGALFGLTDFAPIPDWVASTGAKSGVLFYAGTGFIATNYHAILRTWKKYKKDE
jgi:hypothetical protein